MFPDRHHPWLANLACMNEDGCLLSKRKHPAHGVRTTARIPVIVFLTVCTRNRKRWLASEEAHKVLRGAWNDADAWHVGSYVLMPDHVHLFCAPAATDLSLDKWVRYWKSGFCRATAGTGWRWQTDHWDTRLRRREHYGREWEYVRQNPVRAGLVSCVEEWPYQGVIHDLPW